MIKDFQLVVLYFLPVFAEKYYESHPMDVEYATSA